MAGLTTPHLLGVPREVARTVKKLKAIFFNIIAMIVWQKKVPVVDISCDKPWKRHDFNRRCCVVCGLETPEEE